MNTAIFRGVAAEVGALHQTPFVERADSPDMQARYLALSGQALAAYLSDEDKGAIADMVVRATAEQPNLLLKTDPTPLIEQINSGMSIVVFAETGEGLIPIRHATFYQYEGSMNHMAEVGTVCTLSRYHAEFSIQSERTFKGAGHLLYSMMNRWAIATGTFIVGTTTGPASLQLAEASGWTYIPREALYRLYGQDDVIANVCAVCPAIKTGTTDNRFCQRSADEHLLGKDIPINAQLPINPQTAQGMMKLCFIRGFVPPSHSDFQRFNELMREVYPALITPGYTQQRYIENLNRYGAY